LATEDTWNERSRTLPAGLTCAHCMSMVFCADKFDRTPEDATCVWEPGRFRVRVELHLEAVAGLAAYREALENVGRRTCGNRWDAGCAACSSVGNKVPQEWCAAVDALRDALASPDLLAAVRRLQSELAAMRDRRCETCGRWASLAHLFHLRGKGECVRTSGDDGESVHLYGLPRYMAADHPGCSHWIARQTTKDGETP